MTNRSFISDVALDGSGNAIQGAKVYLFAQGTGTTHLEPTVPTGTAVTGSFFAANVGGAALSNPLTTDAHGRWTAYFTTAQRIDAVYSDNNHVAIRIDTGLATNFLQYVVPMEVEPPFDAGGVVVSTPAGDRDYRIQWNGTLATAINIRSGVTFGTHADYGAVVNSVMTANSILGPPGSQSLGTPGIAMQLLNTNTTNAAVPLSSTYWIGKPYARGVDGVGNGTTTFTSASANWTATRVDPVTGLFTSDVGRIIYIQGGGAADGSKDLHTTIASITNANTVVLADACQYVHGSLLWTEPITIGMKIYGQGGGTRNQGSGHPDDGGLVLQAQGGGWDGVAMIDFRNAASWKTQAFGSELFELHHLSMDANSLADYCIVGVGVGTGNASKCSNYTVGGATVANVGLAGNYFDQAGSVDVLHEYFISNKPITKVSKTWQGGTQTLPQATITLNSTANIPTSGGVIEFFSSQGRQLVHYGGVSGATLTGCFGGVGEVKNGDTVQYHAYGANVCQGDFYIGDDYNIATNSHALLVHQNAATGQCFMGVGHMGGGSGDGPNVVIAYGKRGRIPRGAYCDGVGAITVTADGVAGVSITSPNVWVVPLANNVVSQWEINASFYNMKDDGGVPVAFDGANLGGAVGQAGWGYFVGGCTNGHTGGAGTPAFLQFLNNWPTGAGIMMDTISAQGTNALYANDGFSTAKPDVIGADISITTGSSSTGQITVPVKIAQSTTVKRAAASLTGDGGLQYDTNKEAFVQSDGTNWRLLQADQFFDGTSAGGITPNLANGNFSRIAETGAGAFNINAPTNIQAGQSITIVIKNSSGAAITATWNAVYIFAHGAWTDPANTKSRKVTFDYDGTNWVSRGAVSNDY